MEVYDARARSMLAGTGSVVDAFTPPGYPAILALIYAAGGGLRAVAVMHAVVSAATAALTYPIALRLHRSAVAAALASIAVLLYVPLVVYAGFLLTETVFAFLLALWAWLAILAHDRGSRIGTVLAASAGLVLGIAIATRPNLALVLPLLALVVFTRRRPGRRRVGKVARWSLAMALPVLLLASARTSALAGKPSFLATNGGLNFFLARAPYRSVALAPDDPIIAVSAYRNRALYTEVFDARAHHAWDERWFYAEGVRTIAEHPVAALRASVDNVDQGLGLGRMGAWPEQGFWPGWMGHDAVMNGFARAAFWLAWLPVLLLATRLEIAGVLGAARGGARALLLLPLLALVVALLVFIGDPRVRVSFDPIAIALASEAYVRAARSLILRGTRRRTLTSPSS
jgi:4-amino-4-deoxy-L-arabinose transferase-like glycosyltransferase